MYLRLGFCLDVAQEQIAAEWLRLELGFEKDLLSFISCLIEKYQVLVVC